MGLCKLRLRTETHRGCVEEVDLFDEEDFRCAVNIELERNGGGFYHYSNLDDLWLPEEAEGDEALQKVIDEAKEALRLSPDGIATQLKTDLNDNAHHFPGKRDILDFAGDIFREKYSTWNLIELDDEEEHTEEVEEGEYFEQAD